MQIMLMPSQLDYIATLRGGAISWSLQKQKTVALSMMVTEYMALTEGVKHLIWLWRFLQDLQLDQSQLTSI